MELSWEHAEAELWSPLVCCYAPRGLARHHGRYGETVACISDGMTGCKTMPEKERRANARDVRCIGLQANHIPAFMGSVIALGVHHGMSVSTVQRRNCKRLMSVDSCVPYIFVEKREAYKHT